MSTPLAKFERRFADLLDHLGDLDVAALLDALEDRSIEPDETPIVQGEPHDSMLFVEWGALVVEVDGVQVKTLDPGDVVGEVGLLSPGNATATVRAVKTTLLHVLSADALERLWRDHPEVASTLLQGITRVISERIRSIEGNVDLDEDDENGFLSRLRALFGRAA